MSRQAEPVAVRMARKILVTESGCWDWQGPVAPDGYGRMMVGSRTTGERRTALAHRLSWEEANGPIPAGLQLDHLCRNRRCVNPAHLEPVTQRENILRGTGTAAINARKTHCPAGHEYTPENTYTYRSGRDCKACAAAKGRRRRAHARGEIQ